MALDRLSAIRPVGIYTRSTDWDGYAPAKGRHGQPKRRSSQRDRLLALAAPGLDPDTLDAEYTFDAAGALLEVIVRDKQSHREVAVLTAGDMARLSGDSTPGMLFERRG